MHDSISHTLATPSANVCIAYDARRLSSLESGAFATTDEYINVSTSSQVLSLVLYMLDFPAEVYLLNPFAGTCLLEIVLWTLFVRTCITAFSPIGSFIGWSTGNPCIICYVSQNKGWSNVMMVGSCSKPMHIVECGVDTCHVSWIHVNHWQKNDGWTP